VHVHGGVIAALSPPLERLINGPMVEGQTRKVIFPQLQLEDFERICEFAYRGDYSVPKPTTFDEDAVNPRMASVVNACPIVTVYDDLEPSDYESDRYSERESNVGAKKGNLPEHFRRARYPLVGWTRKQFARVADIEPNSHWTQNYAPVFLGHARLYVFAHMYMIAELRNLVLHKLHRTLKRFTLYCSGCSSIVELARYVYDDDLLPGRQNGQIDKLRELVVEFVALNVEHFSEEEVHRDLLNQDGEYAADLLTTTLKWRL
jgi:hypothetical protein